MNLVYLDSNISNYINQHSNDTQQYFQNHPISSSNFNMGGFYQFLLNILMKCSGILKWVNLIFIVILVLGFIYLATASVGNSGERKSQGVGIIVGIYIAYIIFRIMFLGVIGATNVTSTKALIVFVLGLSQGIICFLAPVLLAHSAQKMQHSALLGRGLDDNNDIAPMRNVQYVLAAFIILLVFVGVCFG